MTASPTATLAINGGSIIGQGTVSGSLSLGTTNSSSASISPGITPAGGGVGIGTITITSNFTAEAMSSISIDIALSGAYDLIKISGQAAIWSSIGFNFQQSNTSPNFYQPAAGTYLNFLTADNITGDPSFGVLPNQYWAPQETHWSSGWSQTALYIYTLVLPGSGPPVGGGGSG